MKRLNTVRFPHTVLGLSIGLAILGSVAPARAAAYDLSTPQKAMDLCDKALFDGDVDALRAAGRFPRDADKLFVDFIARGRTLAAARKIVSDAYGPAALSQFTRLTYRPPSVPTRMVVIGNKARLLAVSNDGKVDDVIPIAEFEQVGGQWQQWMAAKDADAARIDDTQAWIQIERYVIDGFAKEVLAKTFDTPESAAAALDSRLRTASDAKYGSNHQAVSVGRWFKYGISVEKSPELAFRVFVWGAEQRDPQAMVEVGNLYASGEGVQKDPAAAAKWFQAAADHENTEGMRRLAVCYQNGNGVSKDLPKALGLLLMAAKTDPEALPYLGDTYRDGRGVPADDAAALKYYAAAADQLKSGTAMIEAAACYERGRDVAKDPAKAFGWYTRAAEAGNGDGMLRLAQCLEAGTGCAKDLKAARTWYEKSAADGNTTAAAWLAAHPTR